MDFVNVRKQTCLALPCVPVQEVATKNDLQIGKFYNEIYREIIILEKIIKDVISLQTIQ